MQHKPGTAGKYAAQLAERDMRRLRRYFERQQASGPSEAVEQGRAEGAQGDLAPSESHKGPQAQGKRNALRP